MSQLLTSIRSKLSRLPGSTEAISLPKSIEHGMIEYQPLQPDEIRVLVLLPGKKMKPISCQLVRRCLKSLDNPYEALSYMWGSPNDLESILVNGKWAQVRKNLYAALNVLRDRRMRRVLWVDALCINQDDNSERSAQVAIMREIYQRATLVLIWLGEATAGSDTLFRGRVEFRLELISKELYALLYRRYWTRLWIIQEIMSADELLIYCGKKAMRWVDLQSYLRRLDTNLPLYYDQYPDDNSKPEWLTELQKARDGPGASILDYRGSAYSRPKTDLTSLFKLCAACGSECEDVRDKIYGLIGLVNQVGIYHPILPDYSKSTAQVYMDCFLASLESEPIQADDRPHERTKIYECDGSYDWKGYIYSVRRLNRLLGRPLWNDNRQSFDALDGFCTPGLLAKMRPAFSLTYIYGGSLLIRIGLPAQQSLDYDISSLWDQESAEDLGPERSTLLLNQLSQLKIQDFHRTQPIRSWSSWDDSFSWPGYITTSTSEMPCLTNPSDGKFRLFLAFNGDIGIASSEIQEHDVLCEIPDIRGAHLIIRFKSYAAHPYDFEIIGRAFIIMKPWCLPSDTTHIPTEPNYFRTRKDTIMLFLESQGVESPLGQPPGAISMPSDEHSDKSFTLRIDALTLFLLTR